MIGVIGYLCLDLFPGLGNEPVEFVSGMLRETGAMPGAPGGTAGNAPSALCKHGQPVLPEALTGDGLSASVLAESMKRLAGKQGKLMLKTVSGSRKACFANCGMLHCNRRLSFRNTPSKIY